MPVSLSGMTLLTSNDNEANWVGTDGPDAYNVFIQGVNSESWQVSKNNEENGILTLAAALAASRGLFIIWMKSDLNFYYTKIDVKITSSPSNNRLFTIATAANPEVSGDFSPIALDYVNNGIETGTYDPPNHSEIDILVDNNASGNIRTVINTWVDAIYFGEGLVINGTTDLDKVFMEAAAIDQTAVNRFGILENYNGNIFCQGDLTLNGILTSEDERFTFVGNSNGYDRYNLHLLGNIIFTNTSIFISGVGKDYDMDCSTALSFTMSGGSINGANIFVIGSGQNLNDVILNNVADSTISNDTANCVFNTCGQVTVTAGGSLTTCALNDSIDSAASSTPELALLDECEFLSSGTGHAVELTDLGTGSMVWNCTTVNYDAGAIASPVVGTNTGNEDIFVNVASGTLTINVVDGSTIPSIRTAGAIVNVAAALVDLKFTLNPSIIGYEYAIYSVPQIGSLSGSLELQHEEVATQDNQTYSYTYSSGDIFAVQILAIGADYVEQVEYYMAQPTNQDVIINLNRDFNN